MEDCDVDEICESLFDNEIFKNCTSAVDPSSFIESCKIDYCLVNTDETLEQIFEAFMGKCKDVLPDDKGVCTWKNEIGLNTCPSRTVWSGCKPQCQAYSSCDNEGLECSDTVLIEGCFCKDGFFLNKNNQCVAPRQCFKCEDFGSIESGLEYSEI